MYKHKAAGFGGFVLVLARVLGFVPVFLHRPHRALPRLRFLQMQAHDNFTHFFLLLSGIALGCLLLSFVYIYPVRQDIPPAQTGAEKNDGGVGSTF